MQLLCGVLFLGETMSTERWVGFAIVWLALVILSVDSLLSVRRRHALETSEPAKATGSAGTPVCDPAP